MERDRKSPKFQQPIRRGQCNVSAQARGRGIVLIVTLFVVTGLTTLLTTTLTASWADLLASRRVFVEQQALQVAEAGLDSTLKALVDDWNADTLWNGTRATSCTTTTCTYTGSLSGLGNFSITVSSKNSPPKSLGTPVVSGDRFQLVSTSTTSASPVTVHTYTMEIQATAFWENTVYIFDQPTPPPSGTPWNHLVNGTMDSCDSRALTPCGETGNLNAKSRFVDTNDQASDSADPLVRLGDADAASTFQLRGELLLNEAAGPLTQTVKIDSGSSVSTPPAAIHKLETIREAPLPDTASCDEPMAEWDGIQFIGDSYITCPDGAPLGDSSCYAQLVPMNGLPSGKICVAWIEVEPHTTVSVAPDSKMWFYVREAVKVKGNGQFLGAPTSPTNTNPVPLSLMVVFPEGTASTVVSVEGDGAKFAGGIWGTKNTTIEMNRNTASGTVTWLGAAAAGQVFLGNASGGSVRVLFDEAYAFRDFNFKVQLWKRGPGSSGQGGGGGGGRLREPPGSPL